MFVLKRVCRSYRKDVSVLFFRVEEAAIGFRCMPPGCAAQFARCRFPKDYRVQHHWNYFLIHEMDFRDALTAESCMTVLFESNYNKNAFLQSVQADDDGLWPAPTPSLAQPVTEELVSKESEEQLQRSVLIQRAQQRRQEEEARKVPTVVPMLPTNDSRVEPPDASLFLPVTPDPAVPQFVSPLASKIMKTGRIPTKAFKIFVASKETVTVNLKPSDDVQACIRAAIDAASSSGILTNVEYQAFDLCILESSSGSPDLDFGALKSERLIDSFGETNFALVPKKGFVPLVVPPSDAVPSHKQQSGSAAGTTPALFLQKENSKIFRVMLPDKPELQHMYELDQVLLNQISNPFVTITVSKTAKASELLLAVCKKGHRGFFAQDHVLVFLNEDGRPAYNDDKTPVAIPPHLPVVELKSQTIALVRRVYQDIGRAADRVTNSSTLDGPDTRIENTVTHEAAEVKLPSRRGSLFAPSLTTHAHYSRREYTIIKINKRGARQERLLSVDSEVIRMSKPKSKGFTPFSSTVKFPEIPFTSLRRFWRPNGPNKQLRIYFESSGTQENVCEFEFATMAEADEFVSFLSAFEIPFEQ